MMFMVGAISFGWFGVSLANALAGTLDTVEHVPGIFELSVQGGIAFALGALGFVAAWWYTTQRPISAAAPAIGDDSYRAATWVAAIADAGYATSRWLVRVHSGLLPRYAFASFVALAAIVLLRVVL